MISRNLKNYIKSYKYKNHKKKKEEKRGKKLFTQKL